MQTALTFNEQCQAIGVGARIICEQMKLVANGDDDAVAAAAVRASAKLYIASAVPNNNYQTPKEGR